MPPGLLLSVAPDFGGWLTQSQSPPTLFAPSSLQRGLQHGGVPIGSAGCVPLGQLRDPSQTHSGWMLHSTHEVGPHPVLRSPHLSLPVPLNVPKSLPWLSLLSGALILGLVPAVYLQKAMSTFTHPLGWGLSTLAGTWVPSRQGLSVPPHTWSISCTAFPGVP